MSRMHWFKIVTCLMFSSVHLFVQAQESFSLEESILFALDNSNEISLKKIEIADAIQNIRELKSAGLPKVSGSIDYQYYFVIPSQPLDDFVSPTVINILNSTVTMDNPIPDFQGEPQQFSFFQRNNLSANIDATFVAFDGSYLAALEAAELFENFSREGMEVTKQEIRSNVTKAYLNVLILDKNKATIQKNITNLEKSIFEIGEMYKSGFMEKLDVDRLQVSLSNLETEMNKLLQVEQLSKNMLKFNMNYPLTEDIVLTEDLDEALNKYKLDDVNLQEEIDFTKRAEYTQILMGLELNQINVKRLKRGYLPRLVLFGNLGESLQRDKLFSDEAGFLPSVSAGASLNIPIYDGNEKNAQLERAKLNRDKRQLDLENFEKGVALQIYNSKLQFLNAKSTVETTERSLALMEEIYEKSLIKFREGVGSSVEVSQAESSLFQAQANYINALYELLNAKTDLDIAQGEI